jgi:hypothetical protein
MGGFSILNHDWAERYGYLGALIIDKIGSFVNYHRSNGTDSHDGRHWCYNSLDALASMFPCCTVDKLRGVLKTLMDGGALLKGNYNKNAYDRTSWYSLSDELFAEYMAFHGATYEPPYTLDEDGNRIEKPQVHLVKSPNDSGENTESNRSESRTNTPLSPPLSPPDNLLSELAEGEPDERVEKSKKTFDHDSREYKAAEYIAKKISRHTPNFPPLKEPKREKTLQRWSSDIDRLLRLDGADFEEFKRVLTYSQNHTFWQTNILSGESLRKNYPRLLAQVNLEAAGDD